MNDDDYGCGGCLTLLILAVIITWVSDNWMTILLVIGGIIAVAALIIGIRSNQAKASEREAAAKAKAAKEAEEKLAKEEASYRAYVQSYRESPQLRSKLHTANEIIEKLHSETDESRRIRILAFFDRYLPVMTEIIEASKHGDADIDDPVSRFTETVKAFSKTLYKVDDVVDVNKTVLENMAIRDGFYDPYAEDLRLDKDIDDEPIEDDAAEPTQTEMPQKAVPAVEEDELAIQDRLDEAIFFDDFDTIREMLDSGVISELDLDDDVLAKVEEFI